MDEFEQNMRTEEQPVPAQGNVDVRIQAVRGELKSLFSSSKMLALIILIGASIFLNISSSITLKNTVYYTYGELLEQFAGSEAADMFYDALNTSGIMGTAGTVGIIIGGLINALPTIIAIIGYALVYSAAKKASDSMETSGLKVLKVMNILGIVGYCLICVVCLFIPVLLYFVGKLVVDTIGTSYLTYQSVASIYVTIGIIVAIICIGIYLLYIFKNVGLNKTINCLKGIFDNGEIKGNASTYAAVFTIIIAAFNIINSLTMLVSGSWMACLSQIALGASGIILGTTILRIKEIVRTYSN